MHSFSDSPIEGAATRLGVDLLLTMGDTALQKRDASATLGDGENDWGLGAPAAIPDDPCFANCMEKLKCNLKGCKDNFPDDDEALKVCREEALNRFRVCVQGCNNPQ